MLSELLVSIDTSQICVNFALEMEKIVDTKETYLSDMTGSKS